MYRIAHRHDAQRSKQRYGREKCKEYELEIHEIPTVPLNRLSELFLCSVCVNRLRCGCLLTFSY
ncbi:hypothetical protein Cenrod_1696 [Candidatus Symbiobacter mobilis CR]|uniref:Uncharacterized protein n=1 Tax=Candidatus Symbiobacter mobilis CR TaxID=946483 RepID=U5N892_9BURK|nr:hypothetical protein Cenrod_1696 [Candidatus Symbiobacter mobilis CR]